MIVDLMRNDLSRVCRPGTVTVDELLDVQPHPGVWHLVSTVHGELADDVGTADLLRATFPPGSVTGAPKLAAEQAIAALEPEPRGAYTGALGLVTPAAGTDLSVVIRTFETDGDRLQLGVGGGITADSVPIREWYECLHKAAPLVTAVGGRLAAALADEPGPPDRSCSPPACSRRCWSATARPVRLAGHLARLDRSVPRAVRPRPARGPAGPGRGTPGGTDPMPRRALRVAVRPEPGALTVELARRPLGPRLTRSALALERPAGAVLAAQVDRPRRAGAGRTAHGPRSPTSPPPARSPRPTAATCSGSTTTGQWCTPPLDEDVLPGVTRREVLDLLAERAPGAVRPATVSELQRAAGAFWTSSLSGAVAVASVDGHPAAGQTEFARAHRAPRRALEGESPVLFGFQTARAPMSPTRMTQTIATSPATSRSQQQDRRQRPPAGLHRRSGIPLGRRRRAGSPGTRCQRRSPRTRA